jgi:hypothetical protein
VNVTFSAAFPSGPMPKKLRAHGEVRHQRSAHPLHRRSSYGRSTIWDASKKDHRHLDPAQLAKLDYFIAQLKRQGIYII